MKIEKLTQSSIPAFKEYFKKHAHQQDESFPPLESFTINEDEPIYVLTNSGEISGAAALMIYPEYREAKTARFRIFHSKDGSKVSYNLLLNKILKHTQGLTSIYCFIEDKYSNITSIWEDIGFESRRFAWILERETSSFVKPEFPNGFELRTFRDGIDENSWCSIINEAFEHTLGHVRMTPQKIADWRIDPSYISGGMKILWHNEKPVATAAMIKEIVNGEEAIFIEAIAVLNSFQGKGLGKNILRAGIEFAKNYGAKKVMLSVNGENEKAAEMYFREGFRKESLYKCYYFDINS